MTRKSGTGRSRCTANAEARSSKTPSSAHSRRRRPSVSMVIRQRSPWTTASGLATGAVAMRSRGETRFWVTDPILARVHPFGGRARTVRAVTSAPHRRWISMHTFSKALLATVAVAASTCVAAPASAHGSLDDALARTAALKATAAPVQSANIEHLRRTRPALDLRLLPEDRSSVRDQRRRLGEGVERRNPRRPSSTGTLPNVLFENEAMNCGERRTEDGVERFALIGVDSVPGQPHRPPARQRRWQTS